MNFVDKDLKVSSIIMWMQARGSGGSAIPTFHMVAKIKGCKLQQFYFLPKHQSKRTDSWKRQRSVNILNKQQKCTILKLSQSDKMLKAAFPFENQQKPKRLQKANKTAALVFVFRWKLGYKYSTK